MCFKSNSEWGATINQYRAAISGSLSYTVVGAAAAWPSPTLTKMAAHETPLTLDLYQTSWMVSLMFFGHIASPLPAAYLMDQFGRKRTCIYLTVLPLVSWLLIFLATSAVHLYLARFIAGLWNGVVTTVIPIYVGEIGEPSLRSSLTTINNLLCNLGMLFAYILGSLMSYHQLAVACVALTLLYLCVFLTVPESPYYFVKRNQRANALKVLRWFRKGDAEENLETEVNRMEKSLREKETGKATIKDILCDNANRKGFIIAVTFGVLRRLSGAGALKGYTSVTLPSVVLGVLTPDTCVTILGLISLLSCILCTFLAVKINKRTLLVVSSSICSVATAVISLWFYLSERTSYEVNDYSDIVFFSLSVYFFAFNIGVGPTGTSIKGELFSPNVKALSSSLTTLAVAFAGFLVNKFYLIVAHASGMYVNFLIFTVSLISVMIFTLLYMPETHNKTLEEINDVLQGKKKGHDSAALL